MADKCMLSVVDSHGSTWLYPFNTSGEADEAYKTLQRVSQIATDEHYADPLQIEVIPVEPCTTATAIAEDWAGILSK